MLKMRGWRWEDAVARKRVAMVALVAAFGLALPSTANADNQPACVAWHPVEVVYVEETGTLVEVGANPDDTLIDGWSWDGT
jgi:hypothetical protein